MSSDDIIYLILLFFSIAFGYYYRTISDVQLKKNVGTAVGLIITLIVSGCHITHSFITFLVNAFIILYLNRRQCHLASFVFSFGYLLFFRSTIYFGIPYPPGHTNLIQMMLTLKLVGLALEVNSNEKLRLSFSDIFHYSFNYIGVLTGPYYRYRTFDDYLHQPFAQYADWKTATLNKLKYVPICAVTFLWASYNWPISYALTDEFSERSWLYRYWFIWPNFVIFRTRIYIGLLLSECACTMAGLGAYPIFTRSNSGEGPTVEYDEMNKIRTNEDILSKTEYDFDTIRNINVYGTESCTTYREAMKHWNICIQYWLAVNVYKRFPSKKYRTVVTMLVSAFWHGIYCGYYVCISTAPLALLIDDVYYKLFLKDEKNTKCLNVYKWIHWFFRMHFFSYQGIAFLLMEVNVIWHYYNSIYHAGLIVGVFLYIIGQYLLKQRRINDKRTNKEKTNKME